MEDNEITLKEKSKTKEKEGIRANLYGRIDVSVKTMDKIIRVLLILIVISIVLGVIF